MGRIGGEAQMRTETYRDPAGVAEAGAAVEPVIVTQLVDLDAPPVRRLMRHRLCHHQRVGRRLGDDAVVGDQMRRRRWRSSVELMGRKRQVGLGRGEEDKGRQYLGRMRVPGGKRVSPGRAA
jgi:hypothetical protein